MRRPRPARDGHPGRRPPGRPGVRPGRAGLQLRPRPRRPHHPRRRRPRPTGNANMAWAGRLRLRRRARRRLRHTPTPGAGRRRRRRRRVRPDAPPPRAHAAHARRAGDHGDAPRRRDAPSRAVLVVGQYGNQSGGDKPMDVYDVSDCAEPRLLETFRWPENIHNLTISGNGRYVFATQPLQVVDLDPLFDGDPATGARVPRQPRERDRRARRSPPARSPTSTTRCPPRCARRRTPQLPEPRGLADATTARRSTSAAQLPTFETFTIVDIAPWLHRDAAGQPAGPPQVISQRSGRGHSVRTATIGGRPLRAPLRGERVRPRARAASPRRSTRSPAPAAAVAHRHHRRGRPGAASPSSASRSTTPRTARRSSTPASTRRSTTTTSTTRRTRRSCMASMWNAGRAGLRRPRPGAARSRSPTSTPATSSRATGVTLDQAWGHVRYVPETGHIWFATSGGGFWVRRARAAGPRARSTSTASAARRPPRSTRPGGPPARTSPSPSRAPCSTPPPGTARSASSADNWQLPGGKRRPSAAS